MGLLLATTFALVLWIVLWATGTKGFDAFLPAAAIVIVAATARIALRYLPGRQQE